MYTEHVYIYTSFLEAFYIFTDISRIITFVTKNKDDKFDSC